MLSENNHFSTSLPIYILTRPVGERDWQEFDRGPGYFTIPDGLEAGIKLKMTNDAELKVLATDLTGLSPLRMIDLAENRNVTDEGLKWISALEQLTELNLSSCYISNEGVAYLTALPRLKRLNLAYCRRLNDLASKSLRSMQRLEYLDLLGCLNMTRSGVAKIEHKGLEIHK